MWSFIDFNSHRPRIASLPFDKAAAVDWKLFTKRNTVFLAGIALLAFASTAAAQNRYSKAAEPTAPDAAPINELPETSAATAKKLSQSKKATSPSLFKTTTAKATSGEGVSSIEVTTPKKSSKASATKVIPESPTAKSLPAAPKGNETPMKSSKQLATDASDDVAAMESVSAEAASFKGVTPGVSTRDDVAKAWGAPKEIAKQNEEIVQLYAVPPFQRVEVNYVGVKVSSIVVRFEQPYPAEAVAKQLGLSSIRSVSVPNESGDVVGMAFPERGVSFAFDTSDEKGKPSMKVLQIVLDPISAEPFVLRAEATLDARADLARCDLEQALSLEPHNAKANWLLARILMAAEQYEKASAAIARAIQADSTDCRFRITNAQLLAQMGQLPEALAEAKKTVQLCTKPSPIKARALCLVADLTASGPKPDYKQSMSLHSQALQMADSLATSPSRSMRAAAKEVLIEAHLGAAHDIAWGDWKEKGKAVSRWLERAVIVADDYVKNDNGNPEQLFHVYTRAMAAYVGIRGEVDPEPTVNAVIATGDGVIAAAQNPAHKAQLQWELGMALYDAVQICQMRAEHDIALKYGEKAADYLAKSHEVKQTTSSSFLLGRLYFRLGTIHAVRDKDHRAAVVWFDKAIPLLERPSPEELANNLGRHGESFVSMGVSYWEAGQRQKAVALSEKGIKFMEQAVDKGMLEKSALSVPYNNLAAMHRKLGSTDKADRFQEMAGRTKTEKLR
jgi:tetratricopeptide (TPR) repeat protein